MEGCRICPRECGVDREIAVGFCGGGAKIKAAKAMIHRWEEPCISGEKGTGAIFFSGCVLKCCYCQNHDISIGNFGEEISEERLGEIMLSLQDQGVSSIDLVSGVSYQPQIIRALDRVKHRLSVPVIWNSGGYEKVESLRQLEGYIDVYLPDLKYASSERSLRYSAAADYFEIATQAILEMHRQVGKPIFDGDGYIKRGVIVRHLVLPGGVKDSFAVLEWLASAFLPGDVMVSVMSQYLPFYKAKEGEYPELGRRLTTLEYQRVMRKMEQLGLEFGYLQQRSSADASYTPVFDLEGIGE